MRLVPREYWAVFPHLLIWHGRRICDARRPACDRCVVNDLCPSSRVEVVPFLARQVANARHREDYRRRDHAPDGRGREGG
jgi:endonuclease-3